MDQKGNWGFEYFSSEPTVRSASFSLTHSHTLSLSLSLSLNRKNYGLILFKILIFAVFECVNFFYYYNNYRAWLFGNGIVCRHWDLEEIWEQWHLRTVQTGISKQQLSHHHCRLHCDFQSSFRWDISISLLGSFFFFNFKYSYDSYLIIIIKTFWGCLYYVIVICDISASGWLPLLVGSYYLSLLFLHNYCPYCICFI